MILGPPKPLALPRRVFYLPPGYKKRTNRVVKGRAKTGEISPNGLVSETEDWEGRVKAAAGPSALRLIVNPDGSLRPMTFAEMTERGYFIPGIGPSGVREC